MDEIIRSASEREEKYRRMTVYACRATCRELLLTFKPFVEDLRKLENIAPKENPERHAFLYKEKQNLLIKYDIRDKFKKALRTLIYRRADVARREMELIAEENLYFILDGVTDENGQNNR